MSWNTDKEPIEYLRQRVRYYEKKRLKILKLDKNPHMIEKYGEEMLRTIIARRLLQISFFITKFKQAVSDLEIIEDCENRVKNHQSFKS